MWERASLKWPTAGSQIQASAEGVTESIPNQLFDATTRMKSLTGDASFGRHALSEEAQAILSLRDELDNLTVVGTVISATPYQFQVGERLESGSYLSPANAVKVLCNKLRDLSDIHRPKGRLYAVAIMVTAESLEDFAMQLRALTEVFTLPDWCQCSRQASALVTNERDKLHQPAQIVQPRFKPFSDLNSMPFLKYLSKQGAQIATLESLASDANTVIDKLVTLSEKKVMKLESMASAIDGLKMLKGSVFSMALSGTTESIATTLKQASVPNKHPLTIASLIISDEPLVFWEELLCSH